VCALALPGGASAADSLIEGGGDNQLTPVDGGGYTAKFGLANTTSGDIEPAAEEIPTEPGCDLAFDPSTLPPNEFTEVTLKVPGTCTVKDNGLTFTVNGEPALSKPLELRAVSKPAADDPEWKALFGFVAGFVMALIVVGVVAMKWYSIDRKAHPLRQPLSELEKTWSFADSWVANLTVAGTVLTALLGSSEVVKSLLGEETEPAIAVATVGGGIALALLGLGQVFILATRTRVNATTPDGGHISVGGLYGAGLLTLTAAFGQLIVLSWAASELELDGFQYALIGLGVAGALLLVVYGFRGLLNILETGTNKPARKRKPLSKPKGKAKAAAKKATAKKSAAKRAPRGRPRREVAPDSPMDADEDLEPDYGPAGFGASERQVEPASAPPSAIL
jgi:hypothetical protein